MPLTPLERKAAFAHAVTMHETTKRDAASTLGLSWTHVELVLEGERRGSQETMDGIAEYCGIPSSEFWGESPATV